MREYKGYTIEHNFKQYLVTSPNGESWEVDTIEEAKADIEADINSKAN